MPWTVDDVGRHNKAAAKSAKSRRQWVAIANGELARGLSDGDAIRAANSATKRHRVASAKKRSFKQAARGSLLG